MTVSREKAKTKSRKRRVRLVAGDPCYDVLVTLRRIIRAVDIQSKSVARESGLTTAQVLILQSIRDLGEVTTGRLADQVNLSQATVTTIIDRLDQRDLVERYRSSTDRRIVHTRLTPDGRVALKKAPALLHERFVSMYTQLDEAKQKRILNSLQEVASMLGGEDIDAAPLLDVAAPDKT